MRAATLYREIEAFIDGQPNPNDVREGDVETLLGCLREAIVDEALAPRSRPSRAKPKPTPTPTDREDDDGAAT